ncbi:MAG: rod shape-determining protein MreD [Paludibacteraceae bacterium]|nr:rod shape-determining protein MreD [Paludibacteraceae bacterium]
MDRVIRYTVMFIVLVLLQAVLFGNIDYFGFICPYVYVLFFIALPIGFNCYGAMGLAFLMGLLIDIFSCTPGVHIASTVLLAFVRDYWIKVILPHNELGSVEPSMSNLGFGNFIKYSLPLVLAHHLILFFAESWSFTDAWFAIVKAVVNAVITMMLILSYYLIKRK